MQELRTIRRTARYYPYFQGLRLVPWGLALLVDRLLGGLWGAYATWQPFSSLALFALALVANLMIDRYYSRTVGYARAVFRPAEAVAITLFIIGLLAAGAMDARYEPAVSLFGLWLGLGFVAASVHVARAHYAVAGGLLVLVGLLPTVGLLANVQAFVLSGWVVGASLVVLGIVDHRWLQRSIVTDRE